MMELPCIAHTLAEGHPSLAGALETGGFDYVVITSPEVRTLLHYSLSYTRCLKCAAMNPCCWNWCVACLAFTIQLTP